MGNKCFEKAGQSVSVVNAGWENGQSYIAIKCGMTLAKI
jgi:hypothetical protein